MTVIINGTTGITNVNGSAAAPAETGTDTDTGIVYGTNTLSLVTGGTTALTIDSSQNVTFADGSKNLTLQQTTAAATNSTSYPGYIAFTGYGWNTSLGSSPLGVRIAAGGAYSPAIGQTAPGLSISTQNTNGSMTQRSILNAYGLGLGTGTLPVSGTGIAFPAAQDPSSDANTLDDYEEGTWTPTFLGSSTNPTVTYSGSNGGTYTKIGRIVIAQCYFRFSSFTGGSGAAQIGGLPYPSASSNVGGVLSASEWNAAFPLNATYTYISGESNGGSTIYLIRNGPGTSGVNVQISNFTNTDTYLLFSMVYYTA